MRRADFIWPVLIAFAWAAIAWPPTWWLQVERVHVFDAVEGQTPAMEVDRTIRRPFRGEWVATVLKEGESGFYTYCTASGGNDYRPGNILPDSVDLNWWTWPTKCDLPAGRYVLNTLWTIYPQALPEKMVRMQSNPFTISARR